MNIERETIAKIAHEVNRAYCLSVGDDSQPRWEDAPDWQRNSVIAGVELHINNPETQPSASHEAWLKLKLEEGWKYGPVKDPEKKEHPCMVPYDQLPAYQQSKDYIFAAICRAMAEEFIGKPLYDDDDAGDD